MEHLLSMGQHWATHLPHCQATFYPGEGHSLLHAHWQEVLSWLAA